MKITAIHQFMQTMSISLIETMIIKRITQGVAPKCNLKPMAKDIVSLVNQLEKEEGAPDGIQFMDAHGKATLTDLYPDDEHDEDSCASDMD